MVKRILIQYIIVLTQLCINHKFQMFKELFKIFSSIARLLPIGKIMITKRKGRLWLMLIEKASHLVQVIYGLLNLGLDKRIVKDQVLKASISIRFSKMWFQFTLVIINQKNYKLKLIKIESFMLKTIIVQIYQID